MAIQIEKNIPIPTKGLRRKYPLGEMEIGDSFFVTNVKRASIYAQCFEYSKKNHGKKFIVKEVEGGVRCWRIE